MNKGSNTARASLRIASMAVLIATAAGCEVQLIAPHDPVLEAGVAEASSEVSAFLTMMEARAGTPDAAYPQHLRFYARTAGALRTLRLRADVTPRSERIVDSLDAIVANVERLRELHAKSGDAGLSPPVIDAMRTAFEVQFRAMFKLLAELRRDR